MKYIKGFYFFPILKIKLKLKKVVLLMELLFIAI